MKVHLALVFVGFLLAAGIIYEGTRPAQKKHAAVAAPTKIYGLTVKSVIACGQNNSNGTTSTVCIVQTSPTQCVGVIFNPSTGRPAQVAPIALKNCTT